jgi:hypothetical protein
VSKETEIVVPANTATNILTLVGALPSAVVVLGFGLYFLIFPDAMGPPLAPMIPFLSPIASQALQETVATVGLTIWLGARGFGALLRALDRRPMLVANLDGLRFDPTRSREPRPRSKVRPIRESGWRRPYTLPFDVSRRIWATESPLTARRVNIGALHLDDTGWVPSDLIARLEELRQRASRGPEVVG